MGLVNKSTTFRVYSTESSWTRYTSNNASVIHKVHVQYMSIKSHPTVTVINPWHAYAHVTGLQYLVCVCVCVSVTTVAASPLSYILRFAHQRDPNDALQLFDSWIFLKMFHSRDMAIFTTHHCRFMTSGSQKGHENIT